jgi:orotidine-5'-phosphate decarboxylase
VFYSPGFVAQGGRLEEASKVAGKSWHAIIGEGIYKAPDIRKAAEEYVSAIR